VILALFLLTMALSTIASRAGPARVMTETAPLIALGGLMLALPHGRWALLVGAVLGTLSPNGQEAGPVAPMEQALLAGMARSGRAVRVFGWYNVGFLPAAAGAGAAGVLWAGRSAAAWTRGRRTAPCPSCWRAGSRSSTT